MGAMTAAAAARDDVPGPRKGGAESTRGATKAPPPRQQQQQPDPPEQGLRCPRCESPNTKFCYYNNYSLSQPRHFCKACRRYWTKGGALRNVPVGGGCRKNKRSSRSAAASRLLALNPPVDGGGGIGVTGAAAADQQSAAGRLGFLVGGGAPVVVSSSPIGGAATSADSQYQLGGAAGVLPLPRLHATPAVGQYVSFGEWPSSSGQAVDLTITGGGGGGIGNASAAGHAMNSSIASSIESLSFINQDLHWKLLQQRLAATMFLPPPSQSSGAATAAVHVVDGAAPAHVIGGAFLHNMAAGAPGVAEAVPAAATTSWFMDTSYVLPSPPTPASTAAAAMVTTTTNGNVGDSGRSSADHDNGTSNVNNNCGSGGITAWAHMSTFTALP